jgi:hypothetical protein
MDNRQAITHTAFMILMASYILYNLVIVSIGILD